jgi:hypothetical protein
VRVLRRCSLGIREAPAALFLSPGAASGIRHIVYLGRRGSGGREGRSRATARAGTPASPPRTDFAVGDPRVMASCVIPGGVRSLRLRHRPAPIGFSGRECLQLRDPNGEGSLEHHRRLEDRHRPAGGPRSVGIAPSVLNGACRSDQRAVNATGRSPSLQPVRRGRSIPSSRAAPRTAGTSHLGAPLAGRGLSDVSIV